MSNTVYITNMNPEHDYKGANQYGAIRPITSGNYAIFKTSRLLEEAITVLLSSSDQDYLLVSGSSVVASICMAVWITMHKKINLLLHDPKQTSYIPRTITREGILLEIERVREKLERRKEKGK